MSIQPASIDNHFSPPACPACGGTVVRNLGALSYANPTTFAGTEIALSHVPQLTECRSCGSWFTRHALLPDEAARLYTESRSDLKWRAGVFETGKPPEVVAALAAMLKPGIRVVDIGCNTGELLDFCRQRGASTTGIEALRGLAPDLRRQGHRVATSLDDVERGGADVIFAFDLVEHLYDLNAFLRDSLRSLKAGGRLVYP